MSAEKRVIALGMTVVLAIACGAWGRVICVDDDAAAGGDGASWATAYQFLQDALTDAATAENPVEIRVAQGIYRPNRSAANPEGAGGHRWDHFFPMDDGMSLLGGYAGVGGSDPNVRDIGAYETVLSGDLGGNDAEVTDAALLRTDPTRDENTLEVLCIYGGQVRLEGCTITGGTAGGVKVLGANSDVIVSDCVFRGNRGNEGDAQTSAGALTAYCDKLRVVRCSFIGNAGDKGAARADYNSFEDCQFTGNYGWGHGGGAGSQYGGTFTDCVFTENVAKGHGGALYFRRGKGSTLTRCVFRGNIAEEEGGALACLGEAVNITDCLFVGNRAGARGGSCVHWSGYATVANCAFIGNRADDCGGGYVVLERGSLDLTNCTIVENRAPEGMFLWSNYYLDENTSYVKMRNCLLSGEADEIYSSGSRVAVAHTCFGQGDGVLSESHDWLELGPGNTEADPCYVDSGYWDANGTPDDPNDDFFVEGDYHLRSQAGRWDQVSGSWARDDVTSPCIDAGDPNNPIGHEPFPNGGVINMGAYGGTTEASKSYFGKPPCEAIIAGDINGDCHVDLEDVIILLGHWLQSGARARE